MISSFVVNGQKQKSTFHSKSAFCSVESEGGFSNFLEEDSLMRDFSYELTRLNSTKETIEHSKDNNYEYYNVECIYSLKKYGTINSTEWYVNQMQTGNYTEMAEEVLEGWINSPSHENGISNPYYHIATVTSRITLNKETKVGLLVVSYHALSKNRGSYSKYTYNSKPHLNSKY